MPSPNFAQPMIIERRRCKRVLAAYMTRPLTYCVVSGARLRWCVLKHRLTGQYFFDAM